MKISCKFGEPSWCRFPLRALMPKISLFRMPLVDTIKNLLSQKAQI